MRRASRAMVQGTVGGRLHSTHDMLWLDVRHEEEGRVPGSAAFPWSLTVHREIVKKLDMVSLR